jgi:hypothetical protein
MTLRQFEMQELVSPDGDVIASPQQLTGALVVYLHTTLADVFAYSRTTLEVLDAYFTKHPPRREYTQAFLLQEFTPALGAFLGEVLVRELDGRWLESQPVLTSRVQVRQKEVTVFREAYEAVWRQRNLVDVYDEAARYV